MKLKIVWLPGRSISLSTENCLCCHRNAILACYIGMYIIFFVTQIHRVRFVSVIGRASRVKPSKNKFWKEVEKKFWEKNFKTKIRNKVWKKVYKKKCWKKFWKKFWKKILKKKFWKKILEKSFDKKSFGKINYKRKTKFITTLISATLFPPC